MKFVLALLAAVAVIGSAAAWDIYDYACYDGGRQVYVQGGDPLEGIEDPDDALIGFESGTYYSGPTPYGQSEGAVFNRLSADEDTDYPVAGSNQMTVAGTQPSQTLTLTQEGCAYTTTRAADSDDNLPEIAAGINTYQNLHFSGYYQGDYGTDGTTAGVYAQFESEGNAGVENLWTITSYTDLERANGRAQPGMIETSNDNTWFTDADIAMGSTADMTVNAFEAPVFSGSVMSYAGFSGGHGDGVIEANAGGFENHVMVHENGIYTGDGFQDAEIWTSVPGAGNFPYW